MTPQLNDWQLEALELAERLGRSDVLADFHAMTESDQYSTLKWLRRLADGR